MSYVSQYEQNTHYKPIFSHGGNDTNLWVFLHISIIYMIVKTFCDDTGGKLMIVRHETGIFKTVTIVAIY